MFNLAYYRQLAFAIRKDFPRFDEKKFLKEVTLNLEDLSLNQRMRNTSLVLRHFLPDDFPASIAILKKTAALMPRGYTALLYPDYVGVFGKEDQDFSLDALKFFTSYGSSEFAVREFLKLDFEKTIRKMEEWSTDKNHHVRRLASEGSRPRLPWSFKLDRVIKDPALTRNILSNLQADPELYVRKSVANHLNDISKEHPEYMIEVVSGWNKKNPHTAWIIKHASRTLIKKGHAGSLAVFDFEKNPKLRVEKLQVTKRLKLGEQLQFSFDLVSEKKSPQKLVVDYIIHYVKKNGEHSAKVFKLKEVNLLPARHLSISSKQLIRDFTTRKHFGGRHLLEIQVNGRIYARTHFDLTI